MAEIRDIYSLQFNAAEFEQQINSSIAKIEELQGAMEGAAESTEELEAATEGLVDLLSQEAEGTEALNQKRDVLVKTQKNLNKESKAYNVIGKEIDTTNGKIAKSTADATTKQKSFFGQIVGGARSLNSLKRAAGLLTGAFRLLGAFNPLGLLITGATVAVGLLGNLFGATEKAKTGLERLNDPALSGQERLEILEEEINRLNEVEKSVGSLTDEEKKSRDELTAKYKETADEIIRIERDRTKELNDLQDRAARLRVKLLGDSTAGIVENFKVETGILTREAGIQQTELFDLINKKANELSVALEKNNDKRAAELRREIEFLQEKSDRLNEEFKLQKQIEKQQRDEALRRKAEEAQRKKDDEDRKKREEAEAERKRKLAEQELALRKAIQSQITDVIKRGSAEIAQNEAIQAAIRRQQALQDFEQFSELEKQRQAVLESLRETETAKQLLLLEKERNEKLAAALQSGKDEEAILKEQQRINKNYNNQRAEIERLTNAEILNSRIELLEGLLDAAKKASADTVALEKEIADLRLKLEELNKPVDIEIDADTEKTKKEIEQIIDASTNLAGTVFDAIEQGYQRLIGRLDEAINRSKSALDEIRSNSEQFNAQQLALEKERLEKLEQERKRAADRAKALAIVQIAIDTAVAVAKAASQTGVGAPIAIAGVLAAIIGGVASAISVAQGANFFEGSEYVDRERKYPHGRDRVPAMLNRGERVITTETNKRYFPALSAIHHGDIPPAAINEFARQYLANGGRSVSFMKEVENNPFFVPVPLNNSGIESRLERIESALLGLPGMMPRTTVTANARGIFTTVETRRKRTENINRISKR
jgi:hypothetical protein